MSNLEKKFSELYDQYVDKIYRFVFLKVNSREIAEDLTSEIFLRGWKAYCSQGKNGNKIENMTAFLYQIARNLIVDHYRKKAQVQLCSAETANLIDTGVELENNAFMNSDMERVKIALTGINEDYREIIVWHYLDDISVRDIGKMLNKSEDAVRVSLHRALKALKEQIGVR